MQLLWAAVGIAIMQVMWRLSVRHYSAVGN
jgi:hypothetical protein